MNPVVVGVAIMASAAAVVTTVKIIADACTSDSKK